MKKIANKVIPLACAISSPFFISADDQSSETKAMLCASNAPVFAANDTNSKNSNGQKRTTYDKDGCVERVITPPAGPLVSNGADVFLTADFIWWKAQQDGLTYAFNGTTGGESYGGLTTNAEKGSLHKPHFKYEPGFKVGLGVLGNHDNWDFFAEYTWLKVDQSSTRNSSEDGGADNLLLGTDTFEIDGNRHPNPLVAEGSWGLHFNVLDASLGRKFWLSKRLAMRPHVGMKFSWIKQEFDVELANPSLLNLNDRLAYDYEVRQFGVGIRAGLDNSFHMSRNWVIFGDFALTGMWNSFKSSREDFYQETPISTQFQPADVHYKTHPVTAVLEMDLGLRFQTIFSKGRYMFLMQAGWETQVWFDQGQFVNLNSLPAPGNLSMQGLTIKTGFYF